MLHGGYFEKHLSATMQNERGEFVDPYLPRKWYVIALLSVSLV
jgi:hypothetical protein